MTQMHPGDRTYRNQTVRLADLTVISDVIEAVTFENCVIEGPALVATLGAEGSMVNCTFEGPLDAILWVIPDERDHVIGAIALTDCTLVGCILRRVGLVVPRSQEEEVRQALS